MTNRSCLTNTFNTNLEDMIDSKLMTSKTLIESFTYSDKYESRETTEEVVIDGRDYIKLGTRTATTVVGNLYMIEGSVEPLNKYFLTLGVAREVLGTEEDLESAEERAAVNALMDPVMVLELENPDVISKDMFTGIACMYIELGIQPVLIPTQEEEYKQAFADKYDF